MKTANVEFIAFDASDVITTSGVLTAYFTASNALKSGWEYSVQPGEYLRFKNGPDMWYLTIFGLMEDGGKYQVTSNGTTWYEDAEVESIESATDVDLYLFGATKVDSIPGGVTTLNTFADIFNWVTKNCQQAVIS